ncbi:unnamed protein product, partial [Rotaria magnacalcarata]
MYSFPDTMIGSSVYENTEKNPTPNWPTDSGSIFPSAMVATRCQSAVENTWP